MSSSECINSTTNSITFPHIHAEYADSQAVFSLADGELLAGELPKNKRKFAEAWIEIHREEGKNL